MYGDPNIPPFLIDLIPPIATDSSSNGITPLAPIAPIDHVPSIDVSNSMQ